jgi:hypothetical protein
MLLRAKYSGLLRQSAPPVEMTILRKNEEPRRKRRGI